MLLADFVLKFQECFHQTSPTLIGAETPFRELEEWNSMMALIVISMVDSDFGKELTADHIRNSITVSDLYNAIANL